MFLESKKNFYEITIILFFLLIFALMATSCSKKAEDKRTVTPVSDMDKDGFTFFDLGANSLFSENIRGKLSEKLGDGTIAERTPLDLTINYKGFLQEHFSDLYRIHIKLNDATGARVEHNVINLTYRYPPKEKTPFDYVRLTFSNYTQKPLLFRIESEREGEAILDALRTKYGDPKDIEWKEGKGTTFYWQKGENIMTFSKSTDRAGNPKFHTRIYFVENIKELVITEEQEALEKEEALKKMGKSAF